MKKIIFPILLAVVIFTACQPELSSLPENKHTSLEDFYKTNRAAVQTSTVNNATGGVTTTVSGVKIHFPANGFVTESGSPVTGNADVSVKEILTIKDMILNNMPTTSGGLPLESGGEFNIKVSQNSQPLKLAAGKFLKIEIPKTPGILANTMQVFNGKSNADGSVDWAPNTNPGNFVVGDSTLFTSYSLFCDSINWINCDKFINEPTVSFTVYPANAPSNDSTNCFVHLTGRNTLVKMNWTRGLSYYNSDRLLPVPSTIVGISVKNGLLYASFTPVTVRHQQSVTMNFTAYSEAQLKERLAMLH
jgi:hypothetical protein